MQGSAAGVQATETFLSHRMESWASALGVHMQWQQQVQLWPSASAHDAWLSKGSAGHPWHGRIKHSGQVHEDRIRYVRVHECKLLDTDHRCPTSHACMMCNTVVGRNWARFIAQSDMAQLCIFESTLRSTRVAGLGC
ncbi:hypothetical protein HaLaN_05968 [Haematococcus lacustris]|uniref:Uncharacterized protein n=1 Tax=Haematococcus lacustris TaxID=44745 RepID=A0A699YUH0_HAELA|nr:hypothetical protein HaLaN_05968 [Haematococcus lacustris]